MFYPHTFPSTLPTSSENIELSFQCSTLLAYCLSSHQCSRRGTSRRRRGRYTRSGWLRIGRKSSPKLTSLTSTWSPPSRPFWRQICRLLYALRRISCWELCGFTARKPSTFSSTVPRPSFESSPPSDLELSISRRRLKGRRDTTPTLCQSYSRTLISRSLTFSPSGS